MLLASGGFFLVTLDILIVNLALPGIGDEFGASTAGLQWVIDGYTLLFAALLLFAGNLSDRIGAKRAFTIGIALLAVASVLCALAPGIGLLIAARFAQGAAAAVMVPASMAVIREAFPDPAARARALGVWASGGAVAGAAGPLLGGALTTVDWRLVFAINIPVCALMLIVIPRVAPSPRRPAPFDWAGQALALLALSALVSGLIEGGHIGFGHPFVIAALVVAALSLVAFVAVQARVRHPMMPLGLFRPTETRIAFLAGFAFIFCWFGTVFIASLYLQRHLGLSPLLAGLAFLPSAVVALFGNLGSSPLAGRFGNRLPALAGMSVMTLGLIGMAVVAPLDSAWPVAIMLILVGAGGSVAIPTLTGLVLSGAGEQHAGIASAVFNTFRQVGGAIAIAVFGVLVSGPTAFTTGLRASFVIATALGVLAVVACLGIRSTPGPAHGRQRLSSQENSPC